MPKVEIRISEAIRDYRIANKERIFKIAIAKEMYPDLPPVKALGRLHNIENGKSTKKLLKYIALVKKHCPKMKETDIFKW